MASIVADYSKDYGGPGSGWSQGSQSATQKIQDYERLRAALDADRNTFIATWRELNDYILPRRGRFMVSDNNKGNRRSQNIIDSTATLSARTLASGLMAGVTSPARPWMRLTVPDPVLSENGAVKTWLHDVTRGIMAVLAKSNVYQKLPGMYRDGGVFATGTMGVWEDPDTVIRCYDFPIGSYYLGNDAQNRPRVFMRDFLWSVRQVVGEFAERGKDGPKLDKFSAEVQSAWARKDLDKPTVEVCHVISPNLDYNPGRLDAKDNKPFYECYYERGKARDRFLRESGYDEWPILAFRWETTGEDVWGTDSPGVTALGDVKQLQQQEKRGAEALEKMVRPPMVGPSALKNGAPSILPGGMTWLDETKDRQFRPALAVNVPLDQLEYKQEQKRNLIKSVFFVDVILMLAFSDPQRGRQPVTAREIDERHEEKLLAFGPVLERLNEDVLDPLIDRVFGIMLRRGMIPPAPPELEGMPLKVEYISVMATAQKRVGVAGITELAGFAAQWITATKSLDILDKLDADQMIDEMGDALGVPPRLIVPDDLVAEKRAARAEAQQAAQEAETMAKAAQGVKALSETDVEGPNALTALAGAQSGGGGY